MTPPQQSEQQNESLRIRFYRAYNEDTRKQKPQPVPIGDWLKRAGEMDFHGQPSRYHITGNDQRIYTVVDRSKPPIRFRINRTKYRHVPPSEIHGKADFNYLQEDEGLMDTWYAMVFDDDTQATFVAIATKGNIAPHTMLQDYIKNKLPYEANQLRIEQLAHKNILEKVSKMGDGTIFEISVKPSLVEKIKTVNDNLADALRASETVYPQKELSQVIKPYNTEKFGLKDKFLPIIKFLLEDEQYRTDVTKLRIGGIFGKSNRTTIINLLSNNLTVDVEIPFADEKIAALNETEVYHEIQVAYDNMAQEIREAAEVSEWHEYQSGTKETLLGQTQQQLPLLPQP